ncbi:bifunctional DNA primase/polymerase [Wenjunlia tyrosinilytica]|nr:bifunctional DNA primase/polymerase [Wenjunlia tyrosinilytica]
MDGWDNGLWEAADSVEYVTAEGAAWLASSSDFPRSVRALWTARPWAPSVLPCGNVFDVINLPVLFGRRVLEQLWSAGPGCGPVAVHRSRLLAFCRPGTADRLPSLLTWEEWGPRVPAMLCHGAGDAVTIPPLHRMTNIPSRWVVAPDTGDPWLPGPDVLIWACVRAARAEAAALGSAPEASRPRVRQTDFSSPRTGC